MTPETFQKVRGLFDSAMEQEPEARSSFLRMACPEDGEIVAEVEKLIAAVGETQFSIDLARESL